MRRMKKRARERMRLWMRKRDWVVKLHVIYHSLVFGASYSISLDHCSRTGCHKSNHSNAWHDEIYSEKPGVDPNDRDTLKRYFNGRGRSGWWIERDMLKRINGIVYPSAIDLKIIVRFAVISPSSRCFKLLLRLRESNRG